MERRFGCVKRRTIFRERAGSQINFKGKKLDTCTMTREELETGVEDGAVCRNILQAIGYLPAEPEVIKDRTMLRKEPVTACLDNVHGLGEFLELEILADSEEKKETALGTDRKYSEQSGIPDFGYRADVLSVYASKKYLTVNLVHTLYSR